MKPKRPSPLVGYNTGVQHRGAPYHVQTEDSGIAYPHVITHVFAEGGRIVATRKTSYAEHVGTPAYPEVVRQIIRTQHAEMLRALCDGAYDDGAAPTSPAAAAPRPVPAASAPATPAVPSTPSVPRAPEATTAPARRPPRISLPGTDAAPESIDDIILADLLAYLDE